MTNWIEHNGGPQPVADDVEVQVSYRRMSSPCKQVGSARFRNWKHRPEKPNDDIIHYRILNQHLIDAARLEGIRLGLEAAAEKATEWQIRPSTRFVDDVIRNLNPETIAREAVLDQLTREAQADNMGYDND